MPLRWVFAIGISALLFADAASLWAQTISQTRAELEQELKLAREARAKMEKRGVNVDKDCAEIAKNLSEKKGDDRLVVVKRKSGAREVMTIKRYHELLNQNNHTLEEIAKYLEKANRQAEDYAENCAAATQAKTIEAQIAATGEATGVEFVFQKDYDGFAVGARGTLNGGYPSWSYNSTTPIPPFNPDAGSFGVICTGNLDGGGPEIPALEGSGEMTCAATWRESGHPRSWRCSGGAGHPPDAKSPPEPRHGGARSFGLGGTTNFFFLVWGCQGKVDDKTDAKFYMMGIRANRLGGPADPKDWK